MSDMDSSNTLLDRRVGIGGRESDISESCLSSVKGGEFRTDRLVLLVLKSDSSEFSDWGDVLRLTRVLLLFLRSFSSFSCLPFMAMNLMAFVGSATSTGTRYLPERPSIPSSSLRVLFTTLIKV